MFYVVYSDDAFRLGKKVTNYVYMDMDKLSTLTSVHNGEHFVPSALLILLVMAEYTHLYLLSFQQRIFVRRVQGTSFFRVYLRLYEIKAGRCISDEVDHVKEYYTHIRKTYGST